MARAGKKALPEAQAFVARLKEERPTWEQILLAKGSSPEVWREAIPHMGSMALVRNLANLFRGEQEGWPEGVLHALVEALEANLPPVPLQGDSLILVDVSGSMFSPLSGRGEATYALVAASLGALLYRHTGGGLVGFDNELHPVDLPPSAPLLALVKTLLTSGARGGTFLGRALREVLPGFGGSRWPTTLPHPCSAGFGRRKAARLMWLTWQATVA
ncbi:TROVE domain protein [Meiothermus luteus]|uniref:TROVE domain protein n=1 Tax=Meiothermus luteus TaxID=2026184 RepID=A0A399EDL9_9DEIN|nr:TROVE domain-containing protein [Meiothermus luteus]RIH82018.1 TROVE domain protein [Meiothermus luteus]